MICHFLVGLHCSAYLEAWRSYTTTYINFAAAPYAVVIPKLDYEYI